MKGILHPGPAWNEAWRALARGRWAFLLRLALIVSLASGYWLPRPGDLRRLDWPAAVPFPWAALGLDDPAVRQEVFARLREWAPLLAVLAAAGLAAALVVAARAGGAFVLLAGRPEMTLREAWRDGRRPAGGYLVWLVGLAALGLAGRLLLAPGIAARLLGLAIGMLLAAARDLALPLAATAGLPFGHGLARMAAAVRARPAALLLVLAGRAGMGLALAWSWGLAAALTAALPAALALAGVLAALPHLAGPAEAAPLAVAALLAGGLTFLGTACTFLGFLLYAPAALFLRLYTLRAALALAPPSPPSPGPHDRSA